MEVLYKTSALLLLTLASALLIRRTNPELALGVSALGVCLVLLAAFSLLTAADVLRRHVRDLYGVSDVYLLPVLKCCAAAILSRLTAELCREASQSAAAAAAELVGALSALVSALPLLEGLLRAVENLV